MMTETILRIQLNDLETVRIVCGQDGCKGVIEIPLAEMATRRPGLDHCPLCSSEFARFFPRTEQPLVEFAEVVRKLKGVKGFTLEFTIHRPNSD